MEAMKLAQSALETCRAWIVTDLDDCDRENFKLSIGLRAGGKELIRQIDNALDAIR